VVRELPSCVRTQRGSSWSAQCRWGSQQCTRDVTGRLNRDSRPSIGCTWPGFSRVAQSSRAQGPSWRARYESCFTPPPSSPAGETLPLSLMCHLALESIQLRALLHAVTPPRSRRRREARLDLEVSTGWVSPSRGLRGGDALLLSPVLLETFRCRGAQNTRLADCCRLAASSDGP
jgi:hypothetical protein